jgi:hypothetical protein
MVITVDPTQYNVTGDVTFGLHRKLSGTTANISLTEQPAEFKRQYHIDCVSQTYNVTYRPITVDRHYALNADTQTYSVSLTAQGSTASAYILDADVTTFDVTPQPITTTRNRAIKVSPSGFSVDGSASLAANHSLVVQPTTITVNGQTTLARTYTFTPTYQLIDAIGIAANLSTSRRITAQPASIGVTGYNVAFGRNYVFDATTQTFNVTSTINLAHGRTLTATPGTFDVSTTDAFLQYIPYIPPDEIRHIVVNVDPLVINVSGFGTPGRGYKFAPYMTRYIIKRGLVDLDLHKKGTRVVRVESRNNKVKVPRIKNIVYVKREN